MKFRYKLMVLMVGLAIISNGVLLSVTTLWSRSLLLEEIRSKVLSIASTTARLMDASEHESVKSSADIDGEAFLDMERVLRKVRDANRREDVHVKFVYTLRPAAGRDGELEYVVDAEERGSQDRSEVGDLYKPKDPDAPMIPMDRDDIQILEDEFGTFLSATSPVRDAAGKPVALVGVDVQIEAVLAQTRRLMYIGLAGMGAAAGVAAILGVVLSRRVTRSLEVLMTAVEKVAKGDLQAKVPVEGGGNDEFATLGNAFNSMVPQLADGLKLKESLELAMEVQQALLPSGSPTVDGLEIAGRSIYCDETGGDYYDFIEMTNLSKDTLAIAVGDVTGHGIAAALLMTTARALLRGQAATTGNIAHLITHMNRHLSRDCHGGRFMTMYYLVIDAATRHLRWVSAGHDAAIAYNPATDMFVELEGADLPMGVDADWQYQEFERGGFIDGQVIVIGTDGIWETRDVNGRMFGKTGLRELIRTHARRPCAEIAKVIADALSKYRQGKSQEDDVTLVVMRFVPRKAGGGQQSADSTSPPVEVAPVPAIDAAT
jgi:serine phosphatase RsbU (regulator of sigma subunit)